MAVAVAVAVAVSGGGAVAAAGLTKRFFHHIQKDFLINVLGHYEVKTKVADMFQAKAILPGVKGPERSGVKVNVRYGGEASLVQFQFAFEPRFN